MRDYYELIKPGIVYGNAMTAIAAFVFASNRHADPLLLVATILGLSFSIAAACVVNNVLDRDIDVHMSRTKDRPIPNGRISVRSALVFAVALGVSGLAILYFLTNIYALLVTLFGVGVYLALYTPAKRFTQHSTIIGALAGAVPPVVGYAAVADTVDTTAVLLFLILVCWQMTHFFAIAIFRKEEYKNAKLPIMSVKAGVTRTKILMQLYAFLLTYAVVLLSGTAHLGYGFSIPMDLACVGWILLGFFGFRKGANDARWARSMFFYSIALLILFSVTLALA